MATLYERIGRIIALEPNWSRPVTVEYQYKTGVRTSRAGDEDRDALRQTARMALSFSTILDRPRLQRHMADLAEGQHLPFIVPIQWRNTELTAPAAPGATSVTVAETPFWLVPGAHVVLIGANTREAAVVASVGAGSVDLETPLARGFGTGETLCLAHRARVPDKTEFRAETDSAWTGTVRLDVDPGSEPQPVAAAAPAMFEGREVFLTRPNWRETPQVTFTQEREDADSSVGRIESGSPWADLRGIVQMGFTGLSVDAVDALISLFARMKGQRGSFWMPTRQRDIEPRVSAAAGSSTLEVAGSDFQAAYGSSRVYNVVIVLWSDGSHQVNRVVSVDVDLAFNSVLSMTDPWTAAVDDSATVMWCPLWRFASDLLEVQWLTSRIAEVTLSMQTLPNEAA